jgi:hypothetical protein
MEVKGEGERVEWGCGGRGWRRVGELKDTNKDRVVCSMLCVFIMQI